MKELLQNFFYSFNLRITKSLEIYKLYKRDVFKSNYKDKVLLSYITEPFTLGINYSHTGLRECYAAAEIFHKLGYSVDVYEHSLNKKIDYNQYEIIYGMG